MSKIVDIHLCIQQPLGYVHSLGLLDPARQFRYQLRRLGANVTMAKNRLRHDAVNFVFGAHLGFEAAQCQRQACIFVNLEQLGVGGAKVSPDYLKLLANSAVVDYDAANCAAYARNLEQVPVVPLLYAPYLKPLQAIALEDRVIDLLFIGQINERRRAWLDRIKALGLQVATFDAPLYGQERDQFILNSKAVLNAHFYETSRFEQARAAHCLSLGTPVISERTAKTNPHPAFENCVLWVQDGQLEQFFSQDFRTPQYFELMRAAINRFESTDPLNAYARLLEFATGFVGKHHELRPSDPWQPTKINLGSGKDYKKGWLNLDVLESAQPDLLLDLGAGLPLPLTVESSTLGPLRLEAGSIEIVHANNVLEHVPDLATLMSNCLRLLKTGGEFQIEVPYEHAPTAWQDPTHVRALNEKSWIYYTDWFWYLGWFEHRFVLERSGYLDLQLKDCNRENASFMRILLRKVETTLRERTMARTMQSELRVPEDAVEPRRILQPAIAA